MGLWRHVAAILAEAKVWVLKCARLAAAFFSNSLCTRRKSRTARRPCCPFSDMFISKNILYTRRKYQTARRLCCPFSLIPAYLCKSMSCKGTVQNECYSSYFLLLHVAASACCCSDEFPPMANRPSPLVLFISFYRVTINFF